MLSKLAKLFPLDWKYVHELVIYVQDFTKYVQEIEFYVLNTPIYVHHIPNYVQNVSPCTPVQVQTSLGERLIFFIGISSFHYHSFGNKEEISLESYTGI